MLQKLPTLNTGRNIITKSAQQPSTLKKLALAAPIVLAATTAGVAKADNFQKIETAEKTTIQVLEKDGQPDIVRVQVPKGKDVQVITETLPLDEANKTEEISGQTKNENKKTFAQRMTNAFKLFGKSALIALGVAFGVIFAGFCIDLPFAIAEYKKECERKKKGF